MSKIQDIKEELRPLLTEFLEFEDYQHIFKSFAKVVGYHGNDKNKIKKLLFIPNDEGEIGFSISGLYELFQEFQLLKQLVEKEPYKSLLIKYPESIHNISKVANKIFEEKSIGEEELHLIFNTDKYDEVRETVREDNSSK